MKGSIKRLFTQYVSEKHATTILLLVVFSVLTSELSAQQADSSTVFGYVVPRKNNDSTHHYHAAFKRLGVTGGSVFSLGSDSDEEGYSGLRAEYGFTPRKSLVLDAQLGRGMETALAFHYALSKGGRWQPYFGLGVGGNLGGGGRDGNGRHNGRNHVDSVYHINRDSLDNKDANAYGIVKLGLNYVLIRRVIVSFQADYRQPFTGTTTTGSVGLQMGISYQFGKRR